tara:strand:+ start:1772 stop:3991 length:2220 start_codon:yes stop_codon:yes gene_type:complete
MILSVGYRFTRRTFLGLTSLFFAVGLLSGERPNVVIILADDLGIGDVSAYNENSAWQTPHIDRLASQGMSFSDAHTSSALCTPTRYGILTGRYNWRSRMKQKGGSGVSVPLIDQDRITIADLFNAEGYHTSLIGKWHLGLNWAMKPGAEQKDQLGDFTGIDFSRPISNGPEAHGFEYSYGLMASLSSPPYIFVENSMPTSMPVGTSVNHDEKAFWRLGPVGEDFRHAEVLSNLTERSVDYIEQQAGAEEPFFLYVTLTAPHAPIIPTTEFIGKSNVSAYGDFVVQVDHAVGRIAEAIAADPRLANTIIFFASDNGQSPRADFDDDELPLAGHNGSYIYRGKKFDIYEGGHRVPFIASWPGQIPAGTVSDEVICTTDFIATVADLLDVELPDNAAEDSYSFLPVVTEADYAKPLREATVHHSSDGRFAIRQGDWKLILWPGSGGWAFPQTYEDMRGLPEFQLFNLRNDPGEVDNLMSAHPDRVAHLRELLTQYVVEGRSIPGAPQANEGSPRWPQLEWMIEPEKFGTLMFHETFNRAESQETKDEPGNGWTTSSDRTAAGQKQVDLRDGHMYMHTAEDANHDVSVRHTFEFRDGTVEMLVKLENDDDQLRLNFTDLDLKSVHAGHLFDARISLTEVILQDKKTGLMNLKMRDARREGTMDSAELKQLQETKSKTFPYALTKGEWHLFQVHVEGDKLTVVVNGEEVGSFRSEGFAHPTKRMVRLLTRGHSVIDDMRVWRKR